MDWVIYPLDDEKLKIFGQELANDLARRIMASLREYPKSANDLAKELGVSLSTVAFHIEKLQEAGVIKQVGVTPGRRGKKVLYSLNSEAFVFVPAPKSEAGRVLDRMVESVASKIVPKRTALVSAALLGLLVAIITFSLPLQLMGGPQVPYQLATAPKAAPAVAERPAAEGGAFTEGKAVPVGTETRGPDWRILLLISLISGVLAGITSALALTRLSARRGSARSP